MDNFKILSGLILMFLLVDCSQDNLTFDNFKNIEISQYQLLAPMNFKLIKEQGYDSLVGKIESSGISMSYDCGMYSSSEQNISEEHYTISNEDYEGI